MTDRELLELAAKAADLCVLQMHGNTDGRLYDVTGREWNPLTDDGDALRLAVRLGIHITNSTLDAWASHLTVTAIERLGEDPDAATRRAIVRAAAEIGKAMP